MKEKIKKILLGVLIGFIAFPTITLGGTFVSSLIQGKTVEEAIQILAEQIDALIGRVEKIETTQTQQEQIISELKAELEKERLCNEANRLFYLLPPHSGEGIGRIIGPTNIVDLYNQTINAIQHGAGDSRDLPIIEQYYQNYLSAKAKCEEKQ